MFCVYRRQTETTPSTYTIESEFNYDFSINTLKDYIVVKDRFKNFKIDEEYEDQLKDEECQSISNAIFYLCYKNEEIVLFSINIEMIHYISDYKYYFIEDPDNIDYINEILDKNYNSNGFENLFIRIKMTTKFYKYLSMTNESNEPDELTDNEDYDEIPAIIENSFPTDCCSVCLTNKPNILNIPTDCCSVCLTNKPNILNIPCLHLAACQKCEETGCFLNCSICRVKIDRKVKI